MTTPSPARQPGAFDLVPLVLIAIVLAAIARALTGHPLADTTVSLVVAGSSAALIGMPLLIWALDTDRTRWPTFLMLGAAAGATPMMLMLLSAIAGLTAQLGVGYVRWILRHGATIPVYGSLPWRLFAIKEADAIAIGAATALLIWYARVDPHRSLTRVFLAISAIVAATTALAWAIG